MSFHSLFVIKTGSVIKRPIDSTTSTTSGQADTTSGQTSTTSGQTTTASGRTSTTSGKMSRKKSPPIKYNQINVKSWSNICKGV